MAKGKDVASVTSKVVISDIISTVLTTFLLKSEPSVNHDKSALPPRSLLEIITKSQELILAISFHEGLRWSQKREEWQVKVITMWKSYIMRVKQKHVTGGEVAD